jgi:aminoglycoside 2''-phosphotransferase
MDNAIEKYESRISKINPDISIQKVVFNGEGLVNDIIIVNDEIVFRFAKEEYGVQILKEEIAVLELLRPCVTLDVPKPFYVGQDVIAYPLLKGEALSRENFASLDESAKQTVANQLATFLKELHSIPIDSTIPPTLAPVQYDDWVRIRQGVEEKVFPLLMKHQIVWANQLFDSVLDDSCSFDYESRLIHGDLGCYHILLDPQTSKLSGVIDFGVAGVGDPATDLSCLIQYYGESFVDRLKQQYPEMQQYLKRARFYAQAIELQWVLSGLSSGENFWFVAHLGGARDGTQSIHATE